MELEKKDFVINIILILKKIINEWKGWLQHPEYNPRKLHFLSSFSRNILDKVGLMIK